MGSHSQPHPLAASERLSEEFVDPQTGTVVLHIAASRELEDRVPAGKERWSEEASFSNIQWCFSCSGSLMCAALRELFFIPARVFLYR